MRFSSAGFTQQSPEGEKRCLNSELWHSCAGPLVSLPAVGSRVVYFSQGHSEQFLLLTSANLHIPTWVTASTNKEVDAHIPNDPSLSPQLICQLHNVTMHAYVETDEVNAQMTLQPLSPGDNAPPPLTSFEATGFPSELLREVVLSQQRERLMQMWPIGLRRDGVSGEVRLGYCAINEYPLD